MNETNRLFHVNDTCEGSQSTNRPSATALPAHTKKLKLLASYTARQSSQSATGNSLQQLNIKCLDMDNDEECSAFWHRNKSSLIQHLEHLAHLQLALPFSEWCILAPLRTRMSYSLLSRLIFLKCNKSLLRNIHRD